MTRDARIFNRGFSLRQAFTITNLVILVVGTFFILTILGLLLNAKRDEAALRLGYEAEIARRDVDWVFKNAERAVLDSADSLSLLAGRKHDEFIGWANRRSAEVLQLNTAHYNAYYAFSRKYARQLVRRDGYAVAFVKDTALMNTPDFNSPTTFKLLNFYDTIYQSSPKEDWYQGALTSPGVHYTKLYFDETYIKRVMFSVTSAARDPKTGEIIGVVGIDLTANAFTKLMEGFKIGETGGAFITDEQGVALAPFLNRDLPMLGLKHDPELETKAGFSVNVPGAPILPISPNSHEFRGLDGEFYLLQARKLNERPFYIIAYQKRSEAYAAIYWSLGTMLLLAISFLSISLFFRQTLAKFVVGNIDRILGNISSNRVLFEDRTAATRFERITPEGPREIAQIALQLNMLYARLQASFQEVQSERDRAENATRTKSRFLSVMSHEIRTPLNSMLGLTDVLLRSEMGSEQVRHLKVLQRSGHSLLRILNDILDFSRLEAGKLEIEVHEFELYSLLADIESLMRFDTEAKGIQFKIMAPSSNYLLLGDSIRIRQALLNLVGNSIKFTAKGSVEVRVTALLDPKNHFQFEVSDTGIGMDKTTRDKLFTEFHQADASITRRYGGTGLGLSISKNIVELLGGKISIESEPNKGTTFRFTIPLGVISQWKAHYEETPTGIPVGSAVFNLKPDTRLRVPEARTAPPARTSNLELEKRKAILVVDDDEDNHRLLCAYIGFHPALRSVHVYSGKEALDLLRQNTFALIIMDMQMPEMDGLEATQEIRKLQASGTLAKTPILLLSANTFAEDRQKSLAAGADEHVAKPIKLDDFDQLLKRWIGENS